MKQNCEKDCCGVKNRRRRRAKLASNILAVSTLGLLFVANSTARAKEPNTSSPRQTMKERDFDTAKSLVDDKGVPTGKIDLLFQGTLEPKSTLSTPAAYYSICSTAFGGCPATCDFPGESCVCFLPGGTLPGQCF
jgi:hypothetical protein